MRGIEQTSNDIPYISTEQMVEVDRAMIEDYHIELVQMMENAGRNLAHLTRERFFSGDPGGKRVAVLAGKGGNGGGAMVAARRLHGWGMAVTIVLSTAPESFAAAPAHQLGILRRMNVPLCAIADLKHQDPFDVIVDGLIGYSLKGNPRGNTAALIKWANERKAPVISLDVPSGMDASTGVPGDPTIRAVATMTLALPKKGFLCEGVEDHVGELYLADIGVPPALYQAGALGLQVGPIFARSEILRLSPRD